MFHEVSWNVSRSKFRQTSNGIVQIYMMNPVESKEEPFLSYSLRELICL